MDSLFSKVLSKTTWTGMELWFFKITVFSIGIVVGVYFPAFCHTIMPLLVLIGVIGTVYVTKLWLKKIRF